MKKIGLLLLALAFCFSCLTVLAADAPKDASKDQQKEEAAPAKDPLDPLEYCIAAYPSLELYYPDQTNAFEEMMVTLAANGELKRALEIIDKLNPNEDAETPACGLLALAETLQKEGKKEAPEAYALARDFVVKHLGDYENYLKRLAPLMAANKEKDIEKALAKLVAYVESFDEGPEKAGAQCGLADIYFEAGMKDKAIALADKVAKTEQLASEYIYPLNLAVLQVKLGQKDAADKNFAIALKSFQEKIRDNMSLELANSFIDFCDKAPLDYLPNLLKLAQKAPVEGDDNFNVVRIICHMAKIYAKNGKQDKVEEMFTEAFRALGKDADKAIRAQSKVIISRARLAIGMKEKGIQMLDQANVKIPEPGSDDEPAPYYNVLIGVGVLKARVGDYQGALDIAKKLEDSNAAVLFEVALSMVRNKAPFNDANKALLKSFMQKGAPKESPAE